MYDIIWARTRKDKDNIKTDEFDNVYTNYLGMFTQITLEPLSRGFTSICSFAPR